MALRLPDEPSSTFAHRREAFTRELAGTAALVFSGGQRPRNYPGNLLPFRPESHFLYLTGASIADSALLVADGRAELFIDPPGPDDALWHGESPSMDDVRAGTGVDVIRPMSELADAIKSAGGTDKVGTLPCVDPISRARQARLLARPWGDPTASPQIQPADAHVADGLISLRLVHDAAALGQLKRAAEATTAAHLSGMAVSRPGLYEHDVRAAMELEMVRRGMTTSYGSIVSVKGEVLHNTTYDNELAAGDLLLADVGAECDGWAGDVTRTWPVSGKFSPSQRAIYDIVLAAEVLGVDMVRAKTRYRDIHLRVSLRIAEGLVDVGILRGNPEDLVERGAHALFFPHGVGHLLGLDVHDMEDLGDRAGYARGRTRSTQFGLGYLRLDRDLEPNMAVTIEPGIYFVPAILANSELCGAFDRDKSLNRDALTQFSDVRGIRIEDDVVCTDGDPLVLSAKIPKRPGEVEAQVGKRA